MMYTNFTEIPFQSRVKGRLRQIYCVLCYMQKGHSHTEAIAATVEIFPQVKDYTTVSDKCGRQFAGSTPTFVEWYRSGVMLKKLIEINKLDEHDTRIFEDLLGSKTIPTLPKRKLKSSRPKQKKIHMGAYAAEVDTAFEIVLEEIENAIEGLNKDVAKASGSRDYEHVRYLSLTGDQMTDFRDKVYALQKDWSAKIVYDLPTAETKSKSRKRGKRLSQGLRTREELFRVPILGALVKLGGSAESTTVIKRIGRSLRPDLNQYDMSRLSSSGVLRWENTANWARHEMVKDGLLAANSKRGIWEISEKGIQWLAENQQRTTQDTESDS